MSGSVGDECRSVGPGLKPDRASFTSTASARSPAASTDYFLEGLKEDMAFLLSLTWSCTSGASRDPYEDCLITPTPSLSTPHST